MNNFKGQVKDTLLQNNPVGTWHHAKNIIKDNNKILNEDGFVKERDLPGVVLGEIGSNDHTVYFTKINDFTDEIGVVDEATGVYTTVIRDRLDFQYDCLIEGVYVYNNKKEFIVIWTNGIKRRSSSPFILNVSNPPFEVNPDFSFAASSNIEHLKMFPSIGKPDINIDYESGGDLKSYVAYITMKYVTKDNSDLLYYPISDIAYTSKGLNPILKQGLKLDFTDLSSSYDKLKIGIVVNEEGTLQGYESDIMYYGDETSFTIGISSLEGFTNITADEILISSEIFDKVRTITKTNDELFLGNTTKDEVIDFQKYANNLVLKPIINNAYRTTKRFQEASFLPNEVYSFYVQLKKPNGDYYPNAFHIPNRPATVEIGGVLENDKIDNLSAADKDLHGVSELTFEDDDKVFHYINTGKVVDNVIDWGYWENQETYPNEDEFNSSDIGGQDLRNQPIRYHRFPNVKELRKSSKVDYDAIPGYFPDGSSFKLGVEIEDFYNGIPTHIRDRIGGYRLCYVKRTFNNSLVVGDAFAAREVYTEISMSNPFDDSPGVRSTIKNEQASFIDTEDYYTNVLLGEDYSKYEDYAMSKMRLFSPELMKHRPALEVTHVEAFYHMKVTTEENIPDSFPFPITSTSVAEVSKNLHYAKENNMEARNLWGETGAKIEVKNTRWLDFINIAGNQHKAYIVYVNLLQLKKNLYSGFTSNQLVIAGEFNKNEIVASPARFYYGDVFTKNEMNITSHLTYFDGDDRLNRTTKFIINNLFQSINLAYTEPDTEARTIVIKDDTISILDNFKYNIEVEDKIGASSLLDINGIQTYSAHKSYNDSYPFRINRSIKIPDENDNTKFLRTFLSNSYYEMPNDKGEIIALRGTDYSLYIQQKYGLYLANATDSIKTDKGEAYLGNVDLFYRKPKEVIYDEDGYIGCQSQFACNIFKEFYVTVDRVKGKVFLVGGEQAIEISKMGNEKFFRAFLNTSKDIDLPYTNIGLITGYDDVGERILLTKRDYVLIDADLVNESDSYPNFYIPLKDKDFIDFNNEEHFINKSFTYSYGLTDKAWICEHEYIPNIYTRNNKGIRSIVNNLSTLKGKVYKHNIKNNKGVFYDKKYTSYVDLIFNQHSEIDKIYKSLEWMTEVIAENGGTISNETITHIMAYNNEQCTGLIDLKNYNLINNRKVESTWKFNDLRDLVINRNLPIVDKMDGTIHYENIEFNKPFFEKRNFISNFIVVRLLIDNTTNNDVYINYINVNSIKSYR